MAFSHEKIETNVVLLSILILVTISVGGLIQLVPLATMDQTIEKVQGMRPYSPLEQMGRNIYVREGCYLCHSQMIRPFRDEVERYGHYSLAAESMFDKPFQWGSKRTGPDLHQPADRDGDEDDDREPNDVGFEFFVAEGHDRLPLPPLRPAPRPAGRPVPRRAPGRAWSGSGCRP